MKRVLVQRAVN